MRQFAFRPVALLLLCGPTPVHAGRGRIETIQGNP